MNRVLRRREGFALLVVLWVMAGAAVLSAALALAGRNGVNSARNRILAERSWWRAQDCFARAREAMDGVLAASVDASANDKAWQYLGSLAAADLRTPPDCTVAMEAAGARLDVNHADSAQMVAGLKAIGAVDAPDLASGILDWLDADDIERPGGAECAWYSANGRLCPRNGPLASVLELRRIRGLEKLEGLDEVFSVEPGRIAINSAPAAVLAAIPGFGDEAITRILQQRVAGEPVTDVSAFASLLTPAARDAIAANYPAIVRAATVTPDAWIITAAARAGQPAIGTIIEARLIRSQRHVVLAGLRAW